MAQIEHRERHRDVIRAVTTHLDRQGWEARWESTSGPEDRVARGTLTIDTGAGRHEFHSVVSPQASLSDLELLPHDATTILLSTHISPLRATRVAERGWGGYLDTAGNASLRAAGLVVEITGRRTETPSSRAMPSAPFTRAGLPVTFALLTAHGRGLAPRQRDLAEWSTASMGTVNRVVRALRERKPAVIDRNNHLVRAEALEEEWISSYTALQPRTWPEERFSSGAWDTPRALLEARLPPGVLLGSELAAVQRGARLRPSEALLHVPADARRDTIRLGKLRRSDDGWIRLRPTFWGPHCPGVGTRAPDPLIRADLLLDDDPRLQEVSAHLFGAAR